MRLPTGNVDIGKGTGDAMTHVDTIASGKFLAIGFLDEFAPSPRADEHIDLFDHLFGQGDMNAHANSKDR